MSTGRPRGMNTQRTTATRVLTAREARWLGRAAAIQDEHPGHDCEREGCDTEPCSCTWGAYPLIGGGTGWDIARFDPECPEHGSTPGSYAGVLMEGGA